LKLEQVRSFYDINTGTSKQGSQDRPVRTGQLEKDRPGQDI
jgi:hypothetical protein